MPAPAARPPPRRRRPPPPRQRHPPTAPAAAPSRPRRPPRRHRHATTAPAQPRPRRPRRPRRQPSRAPWPRRAGAGLVGTGKCGLGNGQKATGEPLTLGAIVTKQPGTDFSDITGIANAYFKCVNDNGGINGRPINYIVAEEQTNPQQVAALAAKLIQDDKVLAIVGSASLIDCPVNHAFYEQNNFNVIMAGVPFDCFSTPNISAVNMGPYYSTLGAAQYLVRQGVKSLVTIGANVPGSDHDNSGPSKFAKLNNVADNGTFLENVPISDASGIALKAVQAAGDGGGVVIDFTPPEGLKILQAAQQQGLIDKVKWGWSTPGNDVSVAKALGPAWDGKIGVNAELGFDRLDRARQHAVSAGHQAVCADDRARQLRADGLHVRRHHRQDAADLAAGPAGRVRTRAAPATPPLSR